MHALFPLQQQYREQRQDHMDSSTDSTQAGAGSMSTDPPPNDAPPIISGTIPAATTSTTTTTTTTSPSSSSTTAEPQHLPPLTSTSHPHPPLHGQLSIGSSLTHPPARATPPASQLPTHADAKLPPPPPPPGGSNTFSTGNNGSAHRPHTPGRQDFHVYQPQAPPYPHPAVGQARSASPGDAHDEASASGPPKKRRRPALSCEPCRRRKVKCDRMHPCGPCVRMGTASGCEYDNRFPRAGMAGTSEFPSTAQTPTYRPVATAQSQQPAIAGAASRSLADFEAEVRHHAYTPTTAHPPPQASNSRGYASAPPTNGHDPTSGLPHAVCELQDRLARIERTNIEAIGQAQYKVDVSLQQSIQTLSTRVQELEQTLCNSKQPVSRAGQGTGLTVHHAAPRTRVDQSTIKFWGPTHYMHLFDNKSNFFGQAMSESSRAKFDLSANQHASSAIALFNRAKALRNTIKERNMQQTLLPESLEQLSRTLPPWDVRDQLVGHYLRTFELIYRIFHIPTLRELYNTHYRQPESAPVVVQVQLLLIFSIGSVFADETHRSNLLPLVPRWLYAAQAYLNTSADKAMGDEEWMRVSCLLVLARQANSIGTKEQTYILAGAMVRTAFTIGLHRDPGKLPNISPFRAEMRRRLWHTVLELALMTSYDAAMPPLIAGEDYDCQPPSNIDDQYIIESASTTPITSSHDVYTSASIQVLLAQSLTHRLEVCRMLNDISSDLSYEKALHLSDALQRACTTTADFFGKHLNRFADWSRPKDLHKHIVEAVLWNTQLCIHRAFYSAAKKDQRFHYSRHMCLESSNAIVAPLADLNPRSAAFDDYSKLVLAGRGTFKSPLSLGTAGIMVLEATAQLEEARTRPSQAGPVTIETLIHRLEHVCAQCLQTIKSGDPSCKRFIYLTVSLAMIRAVQAGRDANSAVPGAIGQALKTCVDIMTQQVEATPSIGAKGLTTSSAAHHEDDLSLFENMDFSFDPSWFLTAWDCVESRH